MENQEEKVNRRSIPVSLIVTWFVAMCLGTAIRAFAVCKIWQWFFVAKWNMPYLSLGMAIAAQFLIYIAFIRVPSFREILAATKDKIEDNEQEKRDLADLELGKIDSSEYWNLCISGEVGVSTAVLAMLVFCYILHFFI